MAVGEHQETMLKVVGEPEGVTNRSSGSFSPCSVLSLSSLSLWRPSPSQEHSRMSRRHSKGYRKERKSKLETQSEMLHQ